MRSRGKSTSRISYAKILLKLLKPIQISQHLQDEFLRNGTRSQSLKLEPLYQKAFQGEDINIAIIGGSNAAGGNLEQDEKNIKKLVCYMVERYNREVDRVSCDNTQRSN